jgi:hypothetical protein
VRLVGRLGGARGFVLVTQEPDGLELSYLFAEPEAFGASLAVALYDAALSGPNPHPEYAWVLSTTIRRLVLIPRHKPAAAPTPPASRRSTEAAADKRFDVGLTLRVFQHETPNGPTPMPPGGSRELFHR